LQDNGYRLPATDQMRTLATADDRRIETFYRVMNALLRGVGQLSLL